MRERPSGAGGEHAQGGARAAGAWDRSVASRLSIKYDSTAGSGMHFLCVLYHPCRTTTFLHTQRGVSEPNNNNIPYGMYNNNKNIIWYVNGY